MVQPLDFGQNIFDFISDDPEGRRAIFEGLITNQLQPQGLVGFGNRPFASGLFDRAQNAFFGNLAGQIARQEDPTSFADFVSNDFNLGREFRRTPAFQSGRGTRGLTSSGRFLFNL